MKKKFGIIGKPIKHSLSPLLHKYWFNKYGIDADYSIIEAGEKELPEIEYMLSRPRKLQEIARFTLRKNLVGDDLTKMVPIKDVELIEN